jgi:predicted PurR-regulated permease PerM
VTAPAPGDRSRDGRRRPRRAGRDAVLYRTLVAVGVTAGVVVGLLTLWHLAHVVLLLFAGVLLAVLLRALADRVRALTRLPAGLSLASVVVGLGGLAWLTVRLRGPAIVEQVDALRDALPGAAAAARDRVAQYDWGRRLLEGVPPTEELLAGGGVLSRAPGVLASTVGAIAEVFVVLFVGIFTAAEPEPYVNGAVRLVPVARRERARAVLREVTATMRWWLVGRFVAMAAVFSLTWLGLAWLGVPLAFTLALFAGLLNFIPNVGPILSVVPAALLALVDGPRLALWVVLLYFVVQSIESYVVNPIVDRRTVWLPPAVTLASQLALAVLFGFLGMALATPLAAVVMVLVKMLYVEDVLGDEIMPRRLT